MRPTTRLESTPPDRNAPSGTSLIMCERTASLSTRAQLRDRVRLGSGERLGRPASASTAAIAMRPSVPRQQVSRRQLADALEDRAVARRVEERQVVIERGGVEIARQVGRLEQRLELRPEVEPAVRRWRSASA